MIMSENIINHLENGKIVVIAGFQGIDENMNITTLGRGGSDTTAVALAAALGADACIFNHIGMEKDWDEIILCCVNGDMEIRMVSFTKDNFPLELCSRQQGGKSGGNDDFMCNANNSFDLLHHEDAKVLF